MKFLFVCDIPQVNGETFEVVCSLENMQFMRTNENITQEELEQVTAGAANIYTDCAFERLLQDNLG